jgi:hypothetical protein
MLIYPQIAQIFTDFLEDGVKAQEGLGSATSVRRCFPSADVILKALQFVTVWLPSARRRFFKTLQ